MVKFNLEQNYPTDLDALRPFIDPKSPTALDDIGVAMLAKKYFPTADGKGNSGAYEAVLILAKEYGRAIDWNAAEYPKSKGIPQWVWLAGAAALVGWYVLRNNKPKGIFGTIEGKTFYAGDLS
jgi:hypothetical protein